MDEGGPSQKKGLLDTVQQILATDGIKYVLQLVLETHLIISTAGRSGEVSVLLSSSS